MWALRIEHRLLSRTSATAAKNVRPAVNEYNAKVEEIVAGHPEFVQSFSRAHTSNMMPSDIVSVGDNEEVSAFVTGNFPTGTSMGLGRNPKQLVFGDGHNATSMLARVLFKNNRLLIANVTPTKNKDGKNYDKPTSSAVDALLPAFEELVSSVAKELCTFVAVCPNSAERIAKVLAERSNESIDLRSTGERGGIRIFWQEGKGEAEGRLFVLGCPNIHWGQRLDQRVPQHVAFEGAKMDVKILELLNGAGDGELHVDGKAYEELVFNARRIKNKQAFNGELRSLAAGKVKAGIELTEEEKEERKKQRIDSKTGGTP